LLTLLTRLNTSHSLFLLCYLLFEDFNILIDFIQLLFLNLDLRFTIINFTFLFCLRFIFQKIVFSKVFLINFCHFVFERLIFLSQKIDLGFLLLYNSQCFLCKCLSISLGMLYVFLKGQIFIWFSRTVFLHYLRISLLI